MRTYWKRADLSTMGAHHRRHLAARVSSARASPVRAFGVRQAGCASQRRAPVRDNDSPPA